MTPDDRLLRQRIRDVLTNEDCSENLFKLLATLKDEGVPRIKMLKLLTSFEARHRNDPDETIYDAILLGIDVVFSSTHPRRIF